MSKETEYKLTPKQIEVIESVVNRGDRAEIVQTKDGFKILKVHRGEVKPD